jgi:hypothetical protein
MNQHQYQEENQDAGSEVLSQSVFQVRSKQIRYLMFIVYLFILEISLISL